MASETTARTFARLARDGSAVDGAKGSTDETPRDGDATRDGGGATNAGWFSWIGTTTRTRALGTSRARSSIPMSPRTAVPEHQARREGETWTYPSEKMFHDAMARKGWKPDPRDMARVVAIHNAVNERAWAHLLKFRGRPRDFSPKARLLNFLGYALPFDRHDWVVDRCGEEVRYVIDFYNAVPYGGAAPVAMHLDVRPALDSPSAAWDRLVVQFGWILSGEWARGNAP
ncbi:Holocytochrome c synthase/heme-lyase [Ostreococcus tauri]|uniref:Holocytochrome c-type synthase n=1 Tax=Ostreococcus tauri TaxID=70448 RepID=A0A1Y5I733_OSTTA|nr:Holocytochrome c synthase/heme-lyase [Ostreococcus tauri]